MRTLTPFRCCVAVLVFQVLAFTSLMFRWSWLSRNVSNRALEYFHRTETELYTNGDLNLTEVEDDDECAKNFLESYSRYCEKAIVPSLKVLKQYHDSAGDFSEKYLCPCLPGNLSKYSRQQLS